jgi:hypothetical protein
MNASYAGIALVQSGNLSLPPSRFNHLSQRNSKSKDGTCPGEALAKTDNQSIVFVRPPPRRPIPSRSDARDSSSVEDCEFIDQMMTKYSRYEHAQSSEAPVELPEPDELAENVKLLKNWRDTLEQRRK